METFLDLTQEAAVLPQGSLVTYQPFGVTIGDWGIDAFQVGNEPFIRQAGIVISTAQYNENGVAYFCPFDLKPSPVAEIYCPQVTLSEHDLKLFVRPDLTTTIETNRLLCETVTPETENLLFWAVKPAIESFLDIINPTPEKMAAASEGFLGYNQIGWLEKFPHSDEARTSNAYVLNLTPPYVYNKTGMAMVSRRQLRQADLIHPQRDVVDENGNHENWRLASHSTRNLRIISTRRYSPSMQRDVRTLHRNTIDELHLKTRACLDEETARKVNEEFPVEAGRDCLARRSQECDGLNRG